MFNKLNINGKNPVINFFMLTGRTLTRTVVLILMILFIASGSKAYSQTEKGPNIAPEDSSWVYAYAGFGYYEWKMMSQNEYMSLFGIDETSGIDFKHEAEPFVLKKYGVKANIFLISLGMDYFSDRFSFNTDFDNTRDLQKDNDKRSEQLKFLSGLRLGNWAFSATAVFRDFNSELTSLGYRDMTGGMHDIYYYSEDGTEEILSQGEVINWYTVFSEYELKFDYNMRWAVLGFGLKYKEYESPSVMDISAGPAQDGSVLMYTRNKFVEIFFASKSLYPIWGDFYWQYHVPLSLTVWGEVGNDLFSKETMPLSAGSVGNLSITYLLSHLKIEAGFDYAMYFSLLQLQSVKLKGPVSFNDSYDGSLTTVPAGSNVDLELNRLEFFWGFYVHASVFI